MVSVEVSGPIATLTIDDCVALSQHSASAGQELRDAISACGDRDDLKVIVLRAKTANFCAPYDLGQSARESAVPVSWNEIYAGSTGLYQTLCFSKKVTIAVAEGECAGAGSLLVLCSDLAVAHQDARFHSPFDHMPEANFVLASLTMRLNRLKAWMLDGLPLSAAGAMKSGLINRVAATDAVAEALSMAKSAAKVPLDGIAMSKLMIESCLDAQGVGQDFDMAGFYAASFPRAANSGKAGSR